MKLWKNKFSNQNKILLGIIIVIILVAGGAGLKKYRDYNHGYTKENVVVNKIDLKKTSGPASLPENFPKDIPVDFTNVIESNTSDYLDHSVIVSVFAYTTKTQSQEAVFNSYLNYLQRSGYKVLPEDKNIKTGFILGRKGNVELGININQASDVATVRVAYTERK